MRDICDTTKDDRITVRKVDDSIEVKYWDKQVNKRYDLFLTKDGFSKYVKNLCFMFRTDDDPYLQLQMNFNGFPTYLVKSGKMTRSISRNLEDIANMVVESAFMDVMPPLIPMNKTFYEYNGDECY